MKRSVLIPVLLLISFAVCAQSGMNQPFSGGLSRGSLSSGLNSSVYTSSRGAVASTGRAVAVSTSSGRTNSLGITSSLTGKSVFSTPTSGGMSGGGGFGGGKGAATSSSSGAGFGGSMSLPFSSKEDADEPEGFTKFDANNFNDASPNWEAGPMSDALIPLLLLLSLFFTYKKLKLNK